MPHLAELPTAACWRRLQAAYTAVLAFTHEGDVHAMPVNVCARDGQIWFRATEGVKLRAARARARMAVVVEWHDELAHTGGSVTARGDAREAPEGPPPALRPPVRPWWGDAQRGTWVVVAVDTITGRALRSGGGPPEGGC